MKRMVEEGHELANHCTQDRPYNWDSAEDFEADLRSCEDVLNTFRRGEDFDAKRPKLFRPPCGLVSSAMREVLERRGYLTILGDVYSNDPAICNQVKFHADFLLRNAKSG